MRNEEMLDLNNNISEDKLKREMLKYSEEMKTFLPILQEAKSLKNKENDLEETKLVEYNPKFLYHGSSENLDFIVAKESTQKGSYVYATDNPIHALFFATFRNSSIARAHIMEYIDSNGGYKVKYKIDERIQGALDDIITDKNIIIHVCNAEDFFKPQGAAYSSREWISKEGKNIVPTDKIEVNLKSFFEELEKQSLVEYNRYDKSKDWKTVIDLLGQNYPFGLQTTRANHIEEYDDVYDEFIKNNFPEQLDFSRSFRSFSQKIMAMDIKETNPNMTLEEMTNYKLKHIKSTADSFLKTNKDEEGKINYNADMDKINLFQRQNSIDSEEKGRSL